MTFFEIAAWVVGLVTVAFLSFITFRKTRTKHVPPWIFPASLSALFCGWSVWSIMLEGPTGFWPVHTGSAWGNQVWFDLLFAVAIAWWLILPTARALGMRVRLWLLLVIGTGCIGFLAMLARYCFLLEKQKS